LNEETLDLMDNKANADRFIKENRNKIIQQYRLKYHLMGEYGWINDPNGLIQYNGVYHAFYQHNPYDSVWGPMFWGHATSKDLLKWEYAPLALAPDCEYDRDGCFSGSAIEKDGKLFLMYTGNEFTGADKGKDYKQVQCIAYSEDGIEFKKIDQNPVIDGALIPPDSSSVDFRDPGLFKLGDHYYVLIGTNDGVNKGQILLYESSNLVDWKYIGIIAKGNESMGNNWECPCMFQLADKNVLIISPQNMGIHKDLENINTSIYMIGSLDIRGGKFQFDEYFLLDYGFDFYAPQAFCDSKDRIVMIGWMNTWNVPTPTQTKKHNWAGAMTVPREIVLQGDKLAFRPVDEIESHRCNEFVLRDIHLDKEMELDTYGDCYELKVIFNAQNASEFGLKLRTGLGEETLLSYNQESGLFKFNRDKSGIGPGGERRVVTDLVENKLILRVLVDKCSVEVFINDGEKVMTGLIFPSDESLGIRVFSKGESMIEFLGKWDII